MPEFSLPPLSYPVGALEPHIDARTMEIHHGKHHATYVSNLNAALKDYPDLQNKKLEDLVADVKNVPEAIRMAVRNNGGGHWNHTLFWEIMKPGGAKTPSGTLAEAINGTFGSLENLTAAVNDAGLKRFGSGWSWLVADNAGKLMVLSSPNQDCPLMDGLKPVLGVDVWEHAYYLNYQNRRADYLKAWWNVVNWDEVAKRFAGAR